MLNDILKYNENEKSWKTHYKTYTRQQFIINLFTNLYVWNDLLYNKILEHHELHSEDIFITYAIQDSSILFVELLIICTCVNKRSVHYIMHSYKGYNNKDNSEVPSDGLQNDK